MPEDKCTAQEALAVVLRSIEEADRDLADLVWRAIDEGREVEKKHESEDPRRSYTYREIEPLTHEQALQIAIDVLQSYLIDLPECMNAALREVGHAATVPVEVAIETRSQARSLSENLQTLQRSRNPRV